MENRVFKRMGCEIIASFKKVDGDNSFSPEETTVRDISEGGIRFRSNRFIPIHDRLSMRLNLSKTKSIEAVIKPTWIRELPNVEQHELGASFISLSREDKIRLHDYLALESAAHRPKTVRPNSYYLGSGQ